MKGHFRAVSLYLALGGALVPRVAAAHSLGTSQSDFVVAADGKVQVTLTFAATEALTDVVLDKNHDGAVTPAELEAAEGDLRLLFAHQLEVDAGGRECPLEAYRGAEIVEGDGLELHATYACSPGAASIGVTMFWLSELRGHKHLAHLEAGGIVADKLLSGSNRYVALEAPEGKGPSVTGWRRIAVVALTFAFALFMAGLLVWRYRAVRRMRRGDR